MRLAPPTPAIAYGVLIDIGGSIVAGILLATVYSVTLAADGASLAEIERTLADPDPASWFSVLGFAVGFASSFLGGYVCARVARSAEMRPVGAVAAVSGIVSLLMGSGAYAFEWNALLALAGMATVFAGGWTGARANGRRAA